MIPTPVLVVLLAAHLSGLVVALLGFTAPPALPTAEPRRHRAAGWWPRIALAAALLWKFKLAPHWRLTCSL